ncbi:hypothetical protein QF041_003534 [Paenibacillus sp. W2I17]|nr:hypothetical protein [Paenibacillus sp. W2I17]
MKIGMVLQSCLFVIGLNLKGGESENAKRINECRYHTHQLR